MTDLVNGFAARGFLPKEIIVAESPVGAIENTKAASGSRIAATVE